MRRGLNIDLNSTEPLYFPFNRNHCFLTRRERRSASTHDDTARTQHMRTAIPHDSARVCRVERCQPMLVVSCPHIYTNTHTHRHRHRQNAHGTFSDYKHSARARARTHNRRLVRRHVGTTSVHDTPSTQQRGFTVGVVFSPPDALAGWLAPCTVAGVREKHSSGNTVSTTRRRRRSADGRPAERTGAANVLSSARAAARLAQFAFGFGSEWL